MAKRVKWNIHVEPEVVFLQLCLLWGFSEDQYYIWITIRCYFASLSIDIFVFSTRYSLRYLSHEICYLWYKVYGIRFRSEIICSSYRITTIVLWAKPFGCEKLNKRDFKVLSRCFFHLCISLYSLNLGIVYTDAVSNRHGFKTLKPHRKQHGFEAFTRNRCNRSRNGDLVPAKRI